MNNYIERYIEASIKTHLKRGKSILLLGPRQTGKTTLLKRLKCDHYISLLIRKNRQLFERDPDLIIKEVGALKTDDLPLVIIDEVQKVPALLDPIQNLIDDGKAQFILTGSSARKLKRGSDVNLLPGRVVSLIMDPINLSEYAGIETGTMDLEDILYYGNLPDMISQRADRSHSEIDLESYVETYLEEEIREEGLTRNIGDFHRFLELAGIESGNILNYSKIGSDIGMSHTRIRSYFEILIDCLIAERVDPITKSKTRKKLTKTPRFLMFDHGIRRICAQEGPKLNQRRLGKIFEQWVGLELLRLSRMEKYLKGKKVEVRFWRDPDTCEVDWVLKYEKEYIPIEVKWKESPDLSDCVGLKTFLSEYKEAKMGFVICRTPRPLQLSKNIQALPWDRLTEILDIVAK